MNPDLIRTWLQLPPGPWPPDHYALLGLPPGDADARRVEHHAMERMERLRPYQLMHPEPVTAAMNLLAQAMICLTDPSARTAYDASLGLLPPPRPVSPPPPLLEMPSESELVPLPAVIETAEQPPATLDEPLTVLPAPTHPPLPLPPPPPRLSPRERLPQASLRERFAALARLRRLDRGWRDLGRFLSEPDRGLSRRSDAVALGVALTHLRALLLHAPDGMASPDRPGHLIAALIRSPLSPRTLRELLPSQKEALARDWRAGADLLARAQRRERREVRKLRPPPTFARQVRWGWYFVVQYPDLAWLSMAAAGLGIACWRAFVSA